MHRGLVAAAMAVIVVSSAAADLFSPDRPLSVMDTGFFSFIFAEESRTAAEYLATFADDEYLAVSAMLGVKPLRRIPVVMTPDQETMGGYATQYPYVLIVLLQSPSDPNSVLGAFGDDLRTVFRHELTHVVSLSIRSGIEEAVVAVFGSPLGLSSYLAPRYMVEGAAVSYESLDGLGRANDPLAAAVIRQDIVEGRWKEIDQAGGAWDSYPGGALPYLYGGLFSRYLQDRFGMESYAEVWKGFGAASLARPFDDFLFVKGRFRSVYGIGLDDAWEDFREAMTPRTPLHPAAGTLAGPSGISAIAAAGTTLYWADERLETVFARDASTGIVRPLFRAGSRVSRLDASPDGSAVLVSATVDEAGFARLKVKEWDAATGRLSDLPVARIRDAAWLSSGQAGTGRAGTGRAGSGAATISGGRAIVGVRTEGYVTDIVAASGAAIRVLLHGTERVNYASPVPAPDGRTIYAIAREDGIVSVIRLSLSGGSPSGGSPSGGSPSGELRSVERLVLPDGLSWIRYLSLGEDGVIRFSWDDGSFYRLAELDGDTVRYQTVPVAGGVHWPVLADGRVHHLGRFSAGIAVCAFPADREALGFVVADVRWEDASSLMSTGSVYDAEPVLGTSRYAAARWLAPRFWLPTAAINLDGLVSAGAITVIADPAERLVAALSAGWDLRAQAADLELSAHWTGWAVPLSLGLHDSFTAAGGRTTRLSGASLGLAGAGSRFSGPSLSWRAGAALEGYVSIPAGNNPYAPWSDAAAAFELGAAIEDFTAPLDDPEARTGWGASLLSRIDAPVHPEPAVPSAGFESGIRASVRPGALAVEAYGAVSASPGLAYGPDGRAWDSGAVLSGLYPAWAEFAGAPPGRWFAEAEASLRLLGQEIQRGAGPFYANRLSVRTGARAYATSGGAWTDGIADAGWSAFARATLTWTPNVGAWAGIHPSSYLELWCRPDLPAGTAAAYGLAYLLVASY